jgi:hypothetical protein
VSDGAPVDGSTVGGGDPGTPSAEASAGADDAVTLADADGTCSGLAVSAGSGLGLIASVGPGLGSTVSVGFGLTRPTGSGPGLTVGSEDALAIGTGLEAPIEALSEGMGASVITASVDDRGVGSAYVSDTTTPLACRRNAIYRPSALTERS